ncbi:CapA family protein [Colwellia sp. BRX10-3]|uniref:CapA family protein n=1 Tax=Colwellia sp. BRX10-3 TaxID=2759844 RepID=UPI0015F3E7B6|nr:CapA family protein [Colwellia sp. BRX10-3]MBA6391582.1 CapA family protein [Colwellia sp. BRX10-3]
MSRILFFILIIIAVNLNISAFAATHFALSGRIIDEENHALKDVVVEINKVKAVTNEIGEFSVNAAINDVYQLKFTKDGYFQSIQTFSHFELQQQSSKITDISLVKKASKRVMLAFGGDVMMGRRYYRPYFDDPVLIHLDNKLDNSKAIVQHIKPYMSLADYAAVNLETQIADEKPEESAPKSVTFYSEPEVLAALTWAGIDYVSLGNNHTYDYMDSGLQSTLAFLKQSELGYSGAGVDEESALKAHTETIKNTEFAMLGYVGWEGSANPTQTANDQHGGAAYGSMKNILKSVSEQVEKNKVTIVQYHGSQEYANSPTGVTEQRLKSSLDAGAALAIAHHPHVTQGLELYNNKLIAYSMGNFIFDQNFSATQHSFILYVWLDDGKFHRAEIVPLYVKGYKPTPATGMHRYTVMKRLTELSKQRNTLIMPSGGHGVIRANNQTPSEKLTLAIDPVNGEKVIPLYQLPWHRTITHVELPDDNVGYRLGTNLINGSDFESFATFDSPERGWIFQRSATTLNDFGASGQRSLHIKLAAAKPSTFGMQSFRRVYKASSAMTVKAKFNVQAAVKINFYWQGRKTRQKLLDAFDNSPKHLIGTTELTANEKWQHVELDFNSPRIGYKSYRVIAEITLQDGTSSAIDIDDFALIEWQSAFSKNIQPNFYNTLSYQTAYIGVDKVISAPVMIKFSH